MLKTTLFRCKTLKYPTYAATSRVIVRFSSNSDPFEWDGAAVGIEAARTPPASWYTEGTPGAFSVALSVSVFLSYWNSIGLVHIICYFTAMHE